MSVFNSSNPTNEQLAEWARMTDGNHHKDVRDSIGKWAKANCVTPTTKEVIEKCRRRIVALYDKGEHDGYRLPVDCDESNRMTNLMMAAIENEFGQNTAMLINRTM